MVAPVSGPITFNAPVIPNLNKANDIVLLRELPGAHHSMVVILQNSLLSKILSSQIFLVIAFDASQNKVIFESSFHERVDFLLHVGLVIGKDDSLSYSSGQVNQNFLNIHLLDIFVTPIQLGIGLLDQLGPKLLTFHALGEDVAPDNF